MATRARRPGTRKPTTNENDELDPEQDVVTCLDVPLALRNHPKRRSKRS